MNYTSEVIINLPRNRVVELFDRTENLYKWQKGLKDFTHISGEPGQKGAKSRLTYDERGTKVELIETITKNNLPEEFSASYETKGAFNIVNNKFHETEDGKTKWVMDNEFAFSGIMKVVAVLIKKSFSKQTSKDLIRFKEFAENA